MTSKNPKNPIKGFLADKREIVQHSDSSFEDDVTNHTLIKNYLNDPKRRAAPPESPESTASPETTISVNKSLASPEKTPRKIMRALLKSNELPKGSPAHPLTPSTPPPSSSRSSRRRQSSGAEQQSPFPKSSSGTPSKGTPSSTRKSPRASKQADVSLTSSLREEDEATIDSGSPNLDSQEDPDATIDSGTVASDNGITNGTINEHKDTQATPPRSSSLKTSPPHSTKSQGKNVSFADESPEVMKPVARKERQRKRMKRNSHILDITTDQSGNFSPSPDDENEGNDESGSLSPSFDSPPPSPVTTSSTTKNKESNDDAAPPTKPPSPPSSPPSSSVPTPSTPTSPPSPPRTSSQVAKPRPTAKKPKPSSPHGRSTNSNLDPNISMPLPTPPDKWSNRKKKRVKTEAEDEGEDSQSTQDTEQSDSGPNISIDPSPSPSPSSNPTYSDANTSIPFSTPPIKWSSRKRKHGDGKTGSPNPDNGGDSAPPSQSGPSASTLPNPSPTQAHITNTTSPNPTLPTDISIPFPSPPLKWNAPKRKHGAGNTDVNVTLSPESLRSDYGPSDSRGPSPAPTLFDPNVSAPFDTPPRWESRRGAQKSSVGSLPDSPFSTPGKDREGEREEEEEEERVVGQTRAKSTSDVHYLPPSPPRSSPPPSPPPSEAPEVSMEIPNDTGYERPVAQAASSASSAEGLFTASGGTPNLDQLYDYTERKLFTDSPHPTIDKNMAAYKAIIGKPPISMPPPPPVRVAGGPQGKREVKKAKTTKPRKRAFSRKTDESEEESDEDDLKFPKRTTEDAYYDFARKKISKEAMAAVHKGVNNFWLQFCKNIEEIRLKEGKGVRKKIILSDIKKLAEKMRFTNEMVDFNSLLREMLPKELQECLIPIARAGNVVGVKKLT